METKEFGNGFKTVAVLLQVVCLMIVIVTFSLILNLFVNACTRDGIAPK